VDFGRRAALAGLRDLRSCPDLAVGLGVESVTAGRARDGVEGDLAVMTGVAPLTEAGSGSGSPRRMAPTARASSPPVP
jgi:hypothetical protein